MAFSLRGCRVDYGANLGNGVRGESPHFRTLPNCRFVRSDVHTVDLVVRDVAVDPLDLGSELPQDVTRLLRDALWLLRRVCRVEDDEKELGADPRWVVLCDSAGAQWFTARDRDGDRLRLGPPAENPDRDRSYGVNRLPDRGLGPAASWRYRSRAGGGPPTPRRQGP